MLKLLRFIKLREWLLFLLSLVFILAQVFFDLKIPDYMSGITKLVETGGSVADVWASGKMMIVCSLGSLAASVIVALLAAKIASGFSRRLRKAMYDKVESFTLEEINAFSTASLITRSTNDVTQVQMLIVMAMQVLVKAPIMAVWAITKIAGKAWQWTTATVIAVVIISALLIVVMKFTFPRFRKIQWLQDALNHAARENLNGVRVVRAYNAEAYQEGKFEKANTDLMENSLYVNRVTTIMSPFMSLIMNGLNLSIYWIGAVMINSVVAGSAAAAAEIRVELFADMIVFMSYAMQVIMAFIMVILVVMIAPRALVAAGRINEVLETVPKVTDGTVSADTEEKGEVEFKNVSFTYPNGSGEALSNISFTAHRGETVAFIGSTGAGKTSLVNLVPRFYDATEGEVLVDGVNVKEYILEELYKKISYVPQNAVMLAGTVKSNIVFGSTADEERLPMAMRVSMCEEFVNDMDEKEDSDMAQRGTNFSGGQKQRISIARALCRDAEILIFDDTFSALDYKTDRELRNALKSETEGVTKLVVAQRIGTIMGADKIIVLDEGKQVGMGTHRELLRDCEVYRQIALSQLSEEELAI